MQRSDIDIAKVSTSTAFGVLLLNRKVSSHDDGMLFTISLRSTKLGRMILHDQSHLDSPELVPVLHPEIPVEKASLSEPSPVIFLEYTQLYLLSSTS
jgi:hypothetical protein